MTVKDRDGRTLSSENPVLCGLWKAAGYTEVTEKKTSTKKKTTVKEELEAE